MTPRTHLNLRLSQAGIEKADELAKAFGLARSSVLRAAIAVGFRNIASLEVELTKEGERP